MTKDHLREIDYFRVFGLVSIVIIHSINFFLLVSETDTLEYTLQEISVNLLRYGRYIFMFATGMVLFYSYRDRDLNTEHFYKRRLHNLVIPYALWTAIYLFISRGSGLVEWSGAAGFFTVWCKNLLSGDAYYHLYYIVVTIQFYLLLPFFLVLLKPQRPRLWALIILISGFSLYMVYHHIFEIRGQSILELVAGTPWAGITGWVMQYNNRLLFSYLPFFLLGGLAGLYLEQFRDWIRKYQYLMGLGLLLCVAVVVGQYFYFYRHLGQAWLLTVSIFKPSIYLYSLMVIAVLFRLSLFLKSRGALQGLTSILSANSLGIYILHPAVLFLLHTFYYFLQGNPQKYLVFIDPLAAIVISCLISLLIGSNRYTHFILGKAGQLNLSPLRWSSWLGDTKNNGRPSEDAAGKSLTRKAQPVLRQARPGDSPMDRHQ
jgi:peptidoglycan/LPS O-acetylase OafA/YrhL